MHACFHLQAINSASMTIHIHIFAFQFFSGIYLGVECLGHSVILYMTFWRISKLYHSHLPSPSDPHPLLSFKPTHCISVTMKLFHFVRSSRFSHPWVFPFPIFSLWILSSPSPGILLSYHLNLTKKNVFSDPLVKVRCLAIHPYHILYPPMITFVTLNSGLFCCDICQLDNKVPEGRDHVFLGHCFPYITWLSVWWMVVTQ